MKKEEYDIWWQLHLREAMGETLLGEELDQYQSALQTLYDEEKLEGSAIALQKTRNKVQQLQNTYTRLRDMYENLEKEIAILESGMSEPTRALLSVGI